MSVALLFSEIWVQGEDCTNCEFQFFGYDPYLPSNSTFSEDLNTTSSYEDPDKLLSLSGTVYRDQLEIEGIKVDYTVSAAFEFVDPLDLALDGIMGLGNDSSSVIYKMYSEGLITQPIYSLNNEDIDASYLILDVPDFEGLGLVVESMQVVDYSLPLQAVFVFNDTEYEAVDVEFSSINSYIVGPYDQLMYFYEVLQAEYGCYYFEEYIVCECENTFPDLHFVIQNATLTVTSDTYLMQVFCK